jgi:hypothetical protein
MRTALSLLLVLTCPAADGGLDVDVVLDDARLVEP